MDQAHRLWHTAQDLYFRPDEFRETIQVLIQQLRTVTWLIQHKKKKIPDFENWYSAWQKRMREDDILRWLVDARNHIEKRGDLETYSTLEAEIISSYEKDMPPILIENNLFDSIQDIFDKLPKSYLENQVLEYGTLKLSRKWVSNDLPHHEILDALGYAYGYMSTILDDAHAQMSLPRMQTVFVHGEEIDAFPGGGPRDGRLPCMVTSGEISTTYISLKTGKHSYLRTGFSDVQNVDQKTVEKRYGKLPDVTHPPKNPSLAQTSRQLFRFARQAICVDGYHITIGVLLQNNQPFQFIELNFEDRSDKYVKMRYITTEIRKFNADGFILIGEQWVSSFDPENPFVYPSDKEDRTEALGLTGCNSDGEDIFLSASIIRKNGAIELSDTEESSLPAGSILTPVKDELSKQA